MKKFVKLLTMFLALCLIFCSCGGGSSRSYDSVATTEALASPAEMKMSKSSYKEAAMDTGWYAEAESPAMMEEMGGGYNGTIGSQENLVNRPDVKLIYTANFSIQTTTFEESVKALRTLVEENEGYFENVYTYNGGMFNKNQYRNSNYTVRVPSQNYNAFINAIGNSFFVCDHNESVEDIGQSYAETEGRIKTLKIKQERLQDLLSKAEKMEDIISLENALSDTEYQLEQFSSTLNRYNSLIGYSTIYVNMNEVVRIQEVQTEDLSFAARLVKSFKKACTNFANNCENFVLWVATNIFTLIIIGFIVFVVIKLGILSPNSPMALARKERIAARKAAREAKKQAKKALKNNQENKQENSEE